MGSGGGGRELQVLATTGCAWTVAADASWISFNSPVSGSGNGTVAFLVATYAGREQRAATITLGDATTRVVQTAVTTPPTPDSPTVTSAPGTADAGATHASAVLLRCRPRQSIRAGERRAGHVPSR